MLRLTRVTDYGILLMTQLAKLEIGADAGRLTANDLALSTRVPAPTVSKILQRLLHANLLDSVRGAHGGYRLARHHALEGISLADMATDGFMPVFVMKKAVPMQAAGGMA